MCGICCGICCGSVLHNCRTRTPKGTLHVKMDRGPSQQDTLTWFMKSQLQAVIKNGIVPQWFHGMISRKAAEELLMSKPPGYFLIRLSGSQTGYTLSYRAKDSCRHFMIDAGKGGYIILGEKKRHRLLQDLVDYHCQTPIIPFRELLTMPCGQNSNVSTDYTEQLFPKRQQTPTPRSPQNKKSDPVPQPEAPALPDRPNGLMNAAVLSPKIQSTRLDPALDENIISHNRSLSPDVPVPAQRKRYGANQITPSQPPELPSRTVYLVSNQNQPCTRTIYALAGPPTDDQHAPNTQPVKSQDAKTSVVTNLKNLKKKILKKRGSSEENIYEEIKVEDTQEVNTPKSSDKRFQKNIALPQEYLPPPPFAPGYS